MSNAVFVPPVPINEPIKSYAPGTPERAALQAEYDRRLKTKIDAPMWIGGKAITTTNVRKMSPPHKHAHNLGNSHHGDAKSVKSAIDAALKAKRAWETMPYEDRAAIFLRAADLLAGPYRAQINAATMLAQGKNAYQAEIDAACELIDFLRFNVSYAHEIYQNQPISSHGVWNRLEYRALEGFVFALSPFNFTAIAGNLPSSCALMGNTVVWKCADTQCYSAQVLMEVFMAAGLPDGVINLIHVSGPVAGDVIFKHKDFAGIHFTGSTDVFRDIWKTIGNNLPLYRSYPRVVGETGGKDFVVAHSSADPKVVATALTRGAFEYQGQKCSAASRAYIPDTIWTQVKKELLADLAEMKMGDPRDFKNFTGAVIDEKSFDKIAGYIDALKKDKKNIQIIAGGKYDKSKGYFIEPTVAVSKDPKSVTMCEEIFGPVLTIHVYSADRWMDTLKLVDSTGEYALTGSVISNDRSAVLQAVDILRHAAGNFYINDKPTGAVVGQQPFGGARGSGTNDKAGSYLNLIRWVSPRTIKETFVPATEHGYPFLG
ncbi:MAG: L-glutamate gamma-semialdehyde dehydrogenase [Flavobacteriales bacterium]|nr:L-glutamate gamma-semialdehyde dehydrogenase [Flavobacteriales bacterium]MBK6943141.1 L-glutamate gamma-semialdehyde dehydrogenase [Flavobacteriales bacterium]MBK9534554.1 L-glutamate gamma-semialdehyde dehydrogenase [Flavobacteriales bacterium]MBP9139705.1 L-glutamate gamma-semialdehyde dehydrogenase [Flavobacteriales bacterium]HQV53211.1 L-glutamate gamma-semialdehyde dehydrogenase [Flavobacteriales bacterium]